MYNCAVFDIFTKFSIPGVHLHSPKTSVEGESGGQTSDWGGGVVPLPSFRTAPRQTDRQTDRLDGDTRRCFIKAEISLFADGHSIYVRMELQLVKSSVLSQN